MSRMNRQAATTIKVKDLVRHLLSGDQEADVLVFGYFGEPYEVSTSDFTFHTIEKGHNPQGVTGSVLEVRAFDIGEEPE